MTTIIVMLLIIMGLLVWILVLADESLKALRKINPDESVDPRR
jgi:hypothetical protein